MNKKYWLVGGIIGAVLSLLVYYFVGISSDWILTIYFPASFYYISGPGMILGSRSATEMYVAFAINGFLYGAIIGWVVGKIKNRQRGTTMK